MKGVLFCDDVEIVRCWVVEGCGIVYKFWFDVYDDVCVG